MHLGRCCFRGSFLREGVPSTDVLEGEGVSCSSRKPEFRGTVFSQMLVAGRMVVRRSIDQKRSQIGLWFQSWNHLLLRLWNSRAWAGLSCKLMEIHLELLSLCSGGLAPPQGGDPFQGILINSFSVSAHPSPPGVPHRIPPPLPSKRVRTTFSSVFYCLQALLISLLSLASQDPMSQVFSLFPLHRGGSWDSQRLSHLPKVAQSVRG